MEIAEMRKLLRSARVRQRKTQAEVASSVGRTRKWISDFELGKADPALSAVVALAETLGVDIRFEMREGDYDIAP